MTLIRKWAWALCLVGSLIASSTNAQDLIAGQIYNTVNLTNSTTADTDTTSKWQNIGLWNQGLPCWGPGGPVYCGPLPYFNNGSFNFSYGTADAYQTIAINKAVPNNTGIQVNGFNFSFTAKNGNGWDNGMQDYLKAYVNVYDSKGPIASYDYSKYTNTKYNWSNFSFSETFANAYTPNSSSTVRYGFVGRDNNGWAGPYGPEIYNVNFSLKYSVDPCVVNPLSSPTCPGFKDAMAKLTPQTTTTTTTTDTTTTATLTTPTAMSDPTKNDVTSSNVGGVQISTTGEITPIINVPKFVRAPNDAGTPLKEKEKEKVIVKPAAPPPTAPVSTARKSKPDDGTSIALMSAQSSTVETATTLQQKTETTQQTSTVVQQQVVSVAPVIVRRAQQAETTSSQDSLSADSSVLSVVQLKPTAAATSNTRKSGPDTSMLSIELPKDLAAKQDDLTQQSLSGKGIGIVAVPQGLKPIVNFNVDVPQISSSFAANMLSPLRSAMETRMIESTVTESTQTVKKDVQNNELAGGVDLSKMAVQPVGFADYMNLALTDAAFYGPKEVYQNQRVVDNARAQRLLQGASDRMHQEMVNSQYNKN